MDIKFFLYPWFFGLIIVSCTVKSNNLVFTGVKSEINDEKLLSTNSNDNELYTFKCIGDKYYDVNDLSYFLNDTSRISLNLNYGSYSDLTPLMLLKNLEELTIYNNNNITTIEPLRSLVNLQKLEIAGCEGIESIDAISGLINLNHLYLTYHETDYQELRNLTKLTYLEIYNDITEVDLIHISELVNLNSFSLYAGGNIKNISLLEYLIDLENLSIVDGGKISLNWIHSLKKLKYLELKSCKVTDVSVLLQLPCLDKIDFSYSSVTDIITLVESATLKLVFEPADSDENLQKYRKIFRENGIRFEGAYDR